MKSIVQVVQNLLKPYIDTNIQTLANSIAPTEDGTNYSKTYYRDEQFFHNGVLYKVTASSVNSSTAINTGSGGNATTADDIVTQISAWDTYVESASSSSWATISNVNTKIDGKNWISLRAAYGDNIFVIVVPRREFVTVYNPVFRTGDSGSMVKIQYTSSVNGGTLQLAKLVIDGTDYTTSESSSLEMKVI